MAQSLVEFNAGLFCPFWGTVCIPYYTTHTTKLYCDSSWTDVNKIIKILTFFLLPSTTFDQPRKRLHFESGFNTTQSITKKSTHMFTWCIHLYKKTLTLTWFVSIIECTKLSISVNFCAEFRALLSRFPYYNFIWLLFAGL